MKKYLGILKSNELNQLSLKEQLDFMLKNELFYISNSYSIDITATQTNVKIDNPKINLKPTLEVANAFYDYLKELLSRNIDQQFLQFFSDFNDRIYGLGNKEQQKIALKLFNKLYKKIKVLDTNFVKKEKDNSGLEQVKNMNRFDLLKGRQNGQTQQLSTTENILQFLNGKEPYFNTEEFKNDSDTEEFITFEARLKILVSLNGRFHFEEDIHFTDLGQLKKLYQKHQDIFKSFEVFVYAHKKIQGFKVAKTEHITSLYDALFEMKLIDNNDAKFLNYLDLEHDISLTILKHYEPAQNMQHDQRKLAFKIELQEYPSEKVELLTDDIEKPYVIKSKKKSLQIFTDKDALDYLFKNTFNCK